MAGSRDTSFVMPAEWEPHEATWIGWPHQKTDWPGKFAPIPWVFAEIVRRLTEGELVHIFVNDAAHEASAKRIFTKVGVAPEQVRFFRKLTDRGWTRDSGPIIVREPGSGLRHVLGFRFNAWAKYPNWKNDGGIPAHAAKRLKLPLEEVRHGDRPVVLEGGSIDVNGRGTILTTEECLLDEKLQVRNPGFSRDDYRTVFSSALGASNVIWLGKGISGDDTHGHVDDLARFISADTIVLCSEKDSADPNYRLLEENRERLQGARLENGSRPVVVPLPMPAPVVFAGQRLPASYANFYFSNAAVLVPTFNDPNDRRALGVLAELIPDRPVIGIHAVDLVWGLGTLHCLTQQMPA